MKKLTTFFVMMMMVMMLTCSVAFADALSDNGNDTAPDYLKINCTKLELYNATTGSYIPIAGSQVFNLSMNSSNSWTLDTSALTVGTYTKLKLTAMKNMPYKGSFVTGGITYRSTSTSNVFDSTIPSAQEAVFVFDDIPDNGDGTITGEITFSTPLALQVGTQRHISIGFEIGHILKFMDNGTIVGNTVNDPLKARIYSPTIAVSIQ